MTEVNKAPEVGAADIPENERTYFVLDCLFQVPMASRFLVWSRSKDDLDQHVLPHYKNIKELQDFTATEISREQADAIKQGANSREIIPSPYTREVEEAGNFVQ